MAWRGRLRILDGEGDGPPLGGTRVWWGGRGSPPCWVTLGPPISKKCWHLLHLFPYLYVKQITNTTYHAYFWLNKRENIHFSPYDTHLPILNSTEFSRELRSNQPPQFYQTLVPPFVPTPMGRADRSLRGKICTGNPVFPNLCIFIKKN